MRIRCLARTLRTALALTLATSTASAQWYELSGTPKKVHLVETRTVLIPQVGDFVVYRARVGGNPRRFWRADADGRTHPKGLSPAVAGSDIDVGRLSPDGQWLVFSADHDVLDRVDLYAARTDGSGNPVRLSTPTHADAGLGIFRILQDSTRVVYSSDQDVDGVRELFSVPIDGSQAPTRLSHGLAPSETVGSFSLAEASGRVVYWAGVNGAMGSLYSVPLDASQAPELLTGALGAGNSTPWVTPDGQRVVFRTDLGVDEECYTVPLDGSAAPLRFDLQPRWEDFHVAFTPDSGLALISCESAGGLGRIFSAPSDASVKPRNLSGSIDVRGAALVSPDGLLVGILDDASTWNLHVAPADASAPPTQLTSYSSNFGVYYALWTPDAQQLLFVAEDPVAIRHELFSVLPDGSQSPVQLSDPAQDVWGSVVLSPDGSRVAYTTNSFEFESWSVPTDASSPPFLLNGPLPDRARAFVSAFSRDGRRVIYVADQRTLDVDEFFAAHARPLAGIGLDLEPETPSPGDVVSLQTTGGVPGNPCLWLLTSIGGQTFNLKLAVTPFGGDGRTVLIGPLPTDPGLSGLELQFFSFSLNGDGKAVQSNREEMVVQ